MKFSRIAGFIRNQITNTLVIAALSVGLTLIGVMSVAHAAPRSISLKACIKAQSERSGLVAQGYGAVLDQGPNGVTTRITPGMLIGVQRLIHLIELVEFRCDVKKMRARIARLKSPAFRRWQALKPPLPQRNPRFALRRSRQ